MFKESTKVFRALSDFNRLRILKMLKNRSLYACEIAHILHLAASTVSRHLAVLKEAEFIVEAREGKWIQFKHNMDPSDARVSYILSNLDFWIAQDEITEKDQEEAKKVDRFEICKL